MNLGPRKVADPHSGNLSANFTWQDIGLMPDAKFVNLQLLFVFSAIM
jgi:hypothetical protein